jgi:hypothetical protein
MMAKDDGRLPSGRATAAAQSNPQAVSSKAGIPDAGKVAQEGTAIYRRSDVRAILFKLNARYREAMRAAEADDNQEWRFNAVQKLRLIAEVRDRLETECPVFTNAAQAIEARSGETGTGSTEGESAVHQDAPFCREAHDAECG